MLSRFLVIPVIREKIRVKLALAFRTGAPTTPVKEMIVTPPLVALKTIKILSMIHHLLHLKQLKSCLCNQKQQHICVTF